MNDFTEVVIDKKELYRGPIFTVEKQSVQLPNGKSATRDIVKHKGAVAILAVEQEKILLVRQFRSAMKQHMIEIPAGKLDREGEVPLEAAKRELEEETNLAAKEWTELLELVPTPGYCTETIHLYQAKDLIELTDAAPLDEDEFVEQVWMDVREAYQKILKGELTDAKTIIAVQFAYQQLRK